MRNTENLHDGLNLEPVSARRAKTLHHGILERSRVSALVLSLAACGSPAQDLEGAISDDGIDSSPPTTSKGMTDDGADGETPTVTSGPGGGSTDGADSDKPDTTGMTSTTGMPGTSDDDNGQPVDPPIIFDVGAVPDAPSLEQACQKVDFLFVIDNSGSMGQVQDAVVGNFPAFIEGIQSTLDDVDSFQLGVVTSDVYGPNPPQCKALSSLVVSTINGGSDSSNSVCGPYADGYNFMTENDDLATSFACAAEVGTNGNGIERMMQAAVEAIQRLDGGPGQCNEGFIRDDALLVLVIISDEAGDSPGTPMTWYNDIVTAKAGIPENIVVMSLVNPPGQVPCNTFGDPAPEITAFTELFGENGFVGDICDDYGPLFTEAVGIIDSACENFIPPG